MIKKLPMVNIYQFQSYKGYLQYLIGDMPNKGRGAILGLSKFIRVNPSFISQVLKGPKHFSMEQALGVSKYFSLKELEREYFFTLIHLERAGTRELENYYISKRNEVLKKSKFVSKRIESKQTLKSEERSIFYAHWVYSAVKLLCTKEKMTLKKIAKELELNEPLIEKAIEFLIDSGLCRNEGSYYKTTTMNTHLPANSPLITSHHKNWRLKAMEAHTDLEERELAFSAPMGISENEFERLKEDILSLIEKTSKRVSKCSTERVACLNIDLFYISR